MRHIFLATEARRMEPITQEALEAGAVLPSLADILKDNPGWLDGPADPVEASVIVNTPPATLATLRNRGGGPKFFKRGARVFYRRRSLLEWLAAHPEKSSTSDPGSKP
jgi:hypothetical protein